MKAVHLAIAVISLFAARPAVAQTNYVHLRATSMVFCPEDHRIYATGDAEAQGALANTVCRINPDTGRIEASEFVGDEPTGIIRSLDGRYLYVLVAGKKTIRQVDRETLKPGLMFPVGQDQAARVIAPIPDVPNGVLALRYNPSVSPHGDNLCVFIDGRPMLTGVGCGSELALGIDPSRIITSSDGSTSDFYCGINAMLHTDTGGSFFNGYHEPLRTSGYGLVLSRDGRVVDPEARQVLGRLHVAGMYVIANLDPLQANGSTANIGRRIQ